MVLAGVGKSPIKLSESLLPLEHFIGYQTDLYCRVVWIEDIVFVSLELTSLQDYAIEKIKECVAKLTSVEFERIFISVTHTFSAPHTRSLKALNKMSEELREKNRRFLSFVIEAVEVSVKQAKETYQEVSVSYQNINLPVSVNRDVERADGYWLGKNSQGFSNDRVPVVTLKDVSGHYLALLYAIDVQSSLMEKLDKSVISSDFAGYISQEIEERLSCVALFLLGAAADQVVSLEINEAYQLEEKIKITAQNFIKQLDHQTQEVAEINLRHIAVAVDGQVLPEMRSLKPTKSYVFEKSEGKTVTVDLLTAGEFALVMLKPELTSVTGYQIQQSSPYPVTMVATMVNGGQKYMADEASYDKITYEAMNSMFYRGSAERVRQAIMTALDDESID